MLDYYKNLPVLEKIQFKLRKFKFETLECCFPDKIKFEKSLGDGASGIVYKCTDNEHKS
jgi:hypothetical protein